MPILNPSCTVALPRERNNATDAERATGNATASAPNASKPASLQELRAQLRAQLTRNQSAERETAIPAELHTSESATATEMVELRALVNLVADAHGFTPEDRQEALTIALSDPASALICFRALAARLPGQTAASAHRVTAG